MAATAARASIHGVLPTVLIVDDHAEFRSVARRLLEGNEFQVVGEAADGSGGSDAVRRLHPDLVLLDVQLPDVDGVALCRTLTASPGGPGVVLISSRDATDYGRRLVSCGALGFIAKAELSVASLHAVLRGRMGAGRLTSGNGT